MRASCDVCSGGSVAATSSSGTTTSLEPGDYARRAAHSERLADPQTDGPGTSRVSIATGRPSSTSHRGSGRRSSPCASSRAQRSRSWSYDRQIPHRPGPARLGASPSGGTLDFLDFRRCRLSGLSARLRAADGSSEHAFRRPPNCRMRGPTSLPPCDLWPSEICQSVASDRTSRPILRGWR